MNLRDLAKAVTNQDWKMMVECMKHHKDFPAPVGGENQDGEHVIMSVNEHNITVRTLQSNNWARINTYYDDGTSEELYEH